MNRVRIPDKSPSEVTRMVANELETRGPTRGMEFDSSHFRIE
jgi:hypothetical protein